MDDVRTYLKYNQTNMSPGLKRTLKIAIIVVVVIAIVVGVASIYAYSFFTSPDLITDIIEYELPAGWTICENTGMLVYISPLPGECDSSNTFMVLLPVRIFTFYERAARRIYLGQQSCSIIEPELKTSSSTSYECEDVDINGINGYRAEVFQDASMTVRYSLSIPTNWNWFERALFGKVVLQVGYDVYDGTEPIYLPAFDSFVGSIRLR